MQQRYGRLTFIKDTFRKSNDGHKIGVWRCDCGTEKELVSSHVRNGYTQSCGCLMEETRRLSGTTHGMRWTPEYTSWQAMIRRCCNPKDKDYPRYGGRGIAVYPSWQKNFTAFYQHIGPRPAGTTLDRIDGRKGYEPGNVRWATPLEQSHNRTDLTVLNTPLGQMPLVDYARAIGISKGAAHLRLKRGTLEGCQRV
jgi:hypothetical protein